MTTAKTKTFDDLPTENDAITADGNLTEPELSPEEETSDTEAAPVVDLALERLLDNIISPEEATPWTKVHIYGAEGTGKTINACFAPKPLLVAIESGAKSLKNHPELLTGGSNYVAVMRFKTINQVEILAEKLKQGALPEYETIILDTFSELQKKDLDRQIDEAFASNPGSRTNRYTPEGKDYQTNSEHMRRIAASFRDVPRNVIFISHEKHDKDESTGVVTIRADLTDKVNKTLNAYVDLVGRATADLTNEDEPIFKLQIRPANRVTAKTRIGALPTHMVGWNFNMIHEADLKTKDL